jgi:PhoH-like ATPase
MRKAFVLDTNVLLNSPKSILSFKNSEVIIPLAVLRELDNFKLRNDAIGKNARSINRILDDYRQVGNLLKGITLENNSKLFIKTIKNESFDLLPDVIKNSMNGLDTALLAFMLELKNKYKRKQHILITRDINLRIQCDALGIQSENYRAADELPKNDERYGGVSRAYLSKNNIDMLYQNGELSKEILDVEPYPNEFFVLKSDEQSSSAIARYDCDKKSFIRVGENKNIFGLSPRNKEQNFALNLLLDKSVNLVSLTGPAGTGKTLITLAAGCEQTIHGKYYERMIIIKPIQPVGKDLGFLPGSLDEKLAPWISPIKDNLNFLFRSPSTKTGSSNKNNNKQDNHYLSLLFEKKVIEIEAVAFIRGRSIPNAYIIIDEAQNLSMHELKTIITRAGEGSKIILTGDVEQIDHPQLDINTNGLTYAIEKFKNHGIAGHISLLKGERSALATLASEIL